MPVLLFVIGIFTFVAGLVMIGFGIPINEFSFGNTLISAGTTAAVGGLIIIALGVAVRQLRRIAEMLSDPAYARLALPAEDTDIGAGPHTAPAPTAGGRAPYPPRSRERPAERPMERPAPESFGQEPGPAGAPFGGERSDQSFAPSLRNPDDSSLTVDDEISLSPRHPQGAPAAGAVPPGSLDKTSDSFGWRVPPPSPAAPGAPPPLRPPQPANFDATPAARPQPANFDAMWPVEGKPAKAPPSGPPGAGAPKGVPRDASKDLPEPKADAPAREAFSVAQPASQAAGQAAKSDLAKSDPAKSDLSKPRAVAILKSGVVDGMGYTLYVDGSIEAELPQGTLRFASINELRSHLEKNS